MNLIVKILLALGEFFIALGRRVGREEAVAEQKAKNDALQQHYDEIDSQPRDLDAALGRLRNRSGS